MDSPGHHAISRSLHREGTMANPALSNNPAFRSNAPVSAATLEELYERPAATPAETGRMTYEDTAVKTVILFAVLLATGAVGWLFPPLAFVGAIGGFVLALVNTFKREPSVPLIVAYAALEGLFIGGISAIFQAAFGGVVVQAVLATLVTVGVTLALFASGKVRSSARATKVFLVAMVAYLLFSLVNIGLMLFNAPIAGGPFGVLSHQTIMGIPLGIIIGAL